MTGRPPTETVFCDKQSKIKEVRFYDIEGILTRKKFENFRAGQGCFIWVMVLVTSGRTCCLIEALVPWPF